MGMTVTQKILARHCGLKSVKSGELILADVDMILGNDITTPVAINEFEKVGAVNVFDNKKITLVLDHFTPNKDIKSAMQCKRVRDFAKKYDIKHFFDVGEMGIEHIIVPEKGLCLPGELVVGADSHTCTYGAVGAFSTGVGSTDMAYAVINGKLWFKVPSAIKVVLKGVPSNSVSGKDIILNLIGNLGVDGALYKSLEFCGEGLDYILMDERFTIANMAIECGAKNAVFPVDDKTLEYLKERTDRKFSPVVADDDAQYDDIIEMNLSNLKPTVACPHLPSNIRNAEDLHDIIVDQVVIGSCTNGRISDLRITAELLKGKKIKKGVRLIIIPGSQDIYLQALKEGLIEIFIKSGAVVSTPTCGPCLGGHMGVLAENEVCVSTTNRNFVGRMGHKSSKIYLASPLVATYTALNGYISSSYCEEASV